jgi:hypothetical protein
MIKGGGHWYALLFDFSFFLYSFISSFFSIVTFLGWTRKQKIRKRGLWDGSTWATTYNTGTCFSVSFDDKLVLLLFPEIPTGNPAIVAFYDKRIYKKVTIEVIVPK